jgi:RNA polymerase sigma factor (sigma-70 family)
MNAFIHMSDEEIIKSCISGETRAQKLLFDRYSRRMMGICLRYAQGREEAEDMLQDGWIKVFRNLNSFRFEGSAEGWIKRIMVNTCLDNLRKTKKMFNQVEIEAVQEILPVETGTSSADILSEKDLLKMIHQLSPGYRTVFNLFAIEGYSHKEIADMLSITESTSKSQYSRARVQLQKMFQEENV